MTDERDEEGKWKSGWQRCAICGHEHVAVWPVEAELFSMECPECGHMACEEIRDEGVE